MRRLVDRRHVLLGLLALTAALLVPNPAEARRPWQPRREPVSVQVVDGMGRSLRTFRHHGQTFVLGSMGQRYAVRIANNTGERLEVVLSVDGRDAVHGRRSQLMRDRGYVLSPRGNLTIEGFRTSMDSVAAFRFSDPSESFAGEMGDSMMSLGIIQVVVFRERPPEAVLAEPSDDMRAAPRRPAAKRRPSSSAAGETRSVEGSRRKDRASRPSQLGTERGEERMSRVTRVTFERAQGGAAQVVSLRYDSAAGLEARGIRLAPMMRPMKPLSRAGTMR